MSLHRIALFCALTAGLAPLAQNKGIELGVDEFDDSLTIAARPHLVREIFSNLIDNSIQHMGKPGAVAISLRREGQFAHFRLSDDGIGVPASLLPRLFERFFRINPACANSSGLGLAIVKEICDSLGATIEASTPVCAHASPSGLQFDIFFPIPSGNNDE